MEVRHLLGTAQSFVSAGKMSRAFELPVVGGIPQVEETALRQIARLARSFRDAPTAFTLFSEYLRSGRAHVLGAEDVEVMQYIISSGLAPACELSLIRGKRLCDLGRYEDAIPWLYDAVSSDNAGVRAEAHYRLGRALSAKGGKGSEAIAALTSALEKTTEDDLIQKILFYRAKVFNQRGPHRSFQRFAEGLRQITERFPYGEMADDALYELALYYSAIGRESDAFTYYGRLRDHMGPNDWIESAHFRPALLLYSRGRPEDIEEADRLLRRLVETNPLGDLALPAMFWLGRMATETGDTAGARTWFEQVIRTCPYDYYAVRARMHLNIGPQAAREIRADPQTMRELKYAYTVGMPNSAIKGDSPRDYRLRNALRSGLYREVFTASERLRELFPSRLPSELTVDDLDRSGILTSLILLQALRQDAVAAATTGDVADRLAVASAVGRSGGDWPLAMLLVFGLDRSLGTQSAIQRDPRYLHVAYPTVYADLIEKAAGTMEMSPALLYSTMRRESLFYPAALSKRGAIGLFQFMPSAFAALDSRWNLLDRAGVRSMKAYMSDPDLTIQLGARWFTEELLRRNRGNVLFAVMEHNAGYPALRTWRESWERAGRSDDVEYMIETAGFVETRIFTRSVLTDMVIVDALGLFGSGPGTDSVLRASAPPPIP
jgi:soluble lytic murein transglycosylase